MSGHLRAQLVCASLLVCAAHSSTPANPLTIDLPFALARARERAPGAIAAKARVGEIEAARIGAAVRRNPEIEIGGGPRFDDPRLVQIDSRIVQPIDPGRRDARVRVAEAGTQLARVSVDARLRELALQVETTFYEARHADFVVELATRARDLAARAVEAAERRRKAGDITDLDVDLAKIALGRARSALAAAQSERAAQVGRLAVLIGAGPGDQITLAGDLRAPALSLARLEAAVPTRADVRVLEAEKQTARADARLARANGRPELGVWFGYEREEGADILMAGLTFTLPLWNRAQGDKAVARAKQRRVEAELSATSRAASREIRDAFDAYTRAREAVEIFERDVAPVVADSERLLDRSIETGQITVASYLVARQEVIAGRREHVDRRLALAKAAAYARYVAGVTP